MKRAALFVILVALHASLSIWGTRPRVQEPRPTQSTLCEDAVVAILVLTTLPVLLPLGGIQVHGDHLLDRFRLLLTLVNSTVAITIGWWIVADIRRRLKLRRAGPP